VPGIYQVRLTVDGETQSQDLKVIMDPRSPATPEVLQQQLQIGQQAYAETLEARRALAEIGSVQKQLAEVEQKLGGQNSTLNSALADAQSEIAKILTDKASQERPGGLQDGYSGLASALRVVEGGDRAVPSQAVALYQESSQRAKQGIAKWATFKQTKLPQVNQKLREGKFDPVAISEIEEEVQFLMSQ
jgi:paraquat-inducible protein B